MTHRACATLSASSVFGLGGASHSSDLASNSASAIATKVVLPLDTGMNIAWAAQIQVARWMGVVADWKKLLGGAWDKTYAAGNGIYVTCQFGLAQFFGPDAINSRLILIETISFARRYGEFIGYGAARGMATAGRFVRQMLRLVRRTGRIRARRERRGRNLVHVRRDYDDAGRRTIRKGRGDGASRRQ
jgi:hypothetical protein